MTRPLTDRQREILNFIFEFFPREQRMPAIREIAAHLGIRSPNGIKCHFKALAKKGYIILSEGQKSRSIKLARVKVILQRDATEG